MVGDASGAIGIHVGGLTCRAAAGFGEPYVDHFAWPRRGVERDVEAIVAGARRVAARPSYLVIGTPGHVDDGAGTVSGAANLGDEWKATVPLRALIQASLDCPVTLRNDAEVALEAEKRRGGLVAVNDGALITLSTGVGVALLVNGEERPTELGHSVVDLNGPMCTGRPHRGCYESYLGGWALPLRYRDHYPAFGGSAARDIPDDPAFWTECGDILGQLVVTLCLLGQPLQAVSFIGGVSLARQHHLLPAVRRRVDMEAALLVTVPRRLTVTPLGEDVGVMGALLMARDLLNPFRQQ